MWRRPSHQINTLGYICIHIYIRQKWMHACICCVQKKIIQIACLNVLCLSQIKMKNQLQRKHILDLKAKKKGLLHIVNNNCSKTFRKDNLRWLIILEEFSTQAQSKVLQLLPLDKMIPVIDENSKAN